MHRSFKVLAAAVFSLAMAGTASAHVNVRIHTGAPHHHHAPMVHVQPYHAQPPVYLPYREVYVRPHWQARHEWRMKREREREWRRAEWERREAWRRHQWRMQHRHHHHHDRWDDGRRY